MPRYTLRTLLILVTVIGGSIGLLRGCYLAFTHFETAENVAHVDWLGSSPIIGCHPPAIALSGTEAGAPALTRVAPSALPDFDATTSLSVTPRQLGLSLTGIRLAGHLPATVWGFLWLLLSPSVHAVVITPVEPQGLDCFPDSHGSGLPRVHALFGFHVNHFRGLLDVHSRYGLHLRGAANTAFSTEGFDSFVTSTLASIATG